MKNKLIVWIGIICLGCCVLSLPVLADSEETGSATTIPVQVANPPAVQTAPPTALPSDITKITPPTSTSINTEAMPQPVMPSPVNVEPPAINTPPVATPPSNSAPNMMDPTGAMGGSAEPVLNNYSPTWYFSPWFISLLVLILVIALLVVYSLLEGKMPKEEKETEINGINKKKKAKK